MYWIRSVWDDLHQPIYTGEREKEYFRITTIVDLVICLFTVLTTVINFINGSVHAGIVTGLIALGSGLAAVCSAYLKNRHLGNALVILISTGAFAYFAVTGSNEGFAILWILLVPLAIMYFWNVRLGICLSLLYELGFILLFYTPLLDRKKALYTEAFRTRFPILFLFDIAVSSCVMINYHRMALRSNRYEANLNAEVERLTREERQRRIEVEKMSIQTVQTLANAIDAKDRYTNGHSYRVSEYAVRIAEELGWSEDRIRELRMEGLLHDVGKIGIPDTILNKPGRLSDLEFKIIQSHTELGAEILKQADTIADAKEVALYHHEKFGGGGYPTGISGENIPQNARLIGVVDAYDAMNSNRIYRHMLTQEEILEEMEQGRGTQFDPVYLDVFLKLLREDRLNVQEPEIVDLSDKENYLEDTFIEDINQILEKVTSQMKSSGAYDIAYRDFGQLYNYIRNISRRFNLDFAILLVNITPKSQSEVSDARQRAATEAMELAIRKTIRDVDVCSKCAYTQIITVFLGVTAKNSDTIMQRVFTNFYKIFDGSEFDLSYQVSDGHF